MPYVLALSSVLSYLQILGLLRPEFIIMKHRVWTTTFFEVDLPIFLPLVILTAAMVAWVMLKRSRALIAISFGGLSFIILDVSVALAVVALISVIVILYYGRRLREYFVGIFGIVFLVEVCSLLHWLVFVPAGLWDPFQVIANLEQAHFYLVAQFSPGYMLIFSVVGIGVPIFHLSRRHTSTRVVNSNRHVLDNRGWLVLGFILLLSVLVAVYPYLPNINPAQLNPGVDINDYVVEYYKLVSDPSHIFASMNGSRPFFFQLVYVFQKVTSMDPLNAIRFFPVILNPLICISAFALTREITRDESTALYAAFFTASGFTLSVGMYAYFLADMLVLCLFFLSLASLLKALRAKSRIYFGVAIALGGLAVFTHPWTFDQYIVAVGGGAVLTYLFSLQEEGSNAVRWLIAYCLILVGTDFLKVLLFRGSVGGVAALGVLSVGLTSPQTFWLDFVNSSTFYVGGYLTNIPLLTLSVLGIVKIKARTVSNLVLWVLFVATFSVYLVGDIVVKSRLLYNVPVGLFAALGFSFIDDVVVDRRLRRVVKLVIVVLLLSYLFRNLANL